MYTSCQNVSIALCMLFGYSVLNFQFSHWEEDFEKDMEIIKEDIAIAQGMAKEGATQIHDRTGVDVESVAVQVGTGISEGAHFVGENLQTGATIINGKVQEIELSDDVKQKIEEGKNWFRQVWEYISALGAWVAEKLHLAYFSELLCAQIHDHVDHFHPSDLELGSQNLQLRTCAADSIGYQPLLWTEQSQLDRYLLNPLTTNVTSQFHWLIVIGIFLNMVYILRKMCSCCQKEDKNHERLNRRLFWDSVIQILWCTHFAALVYARFSKAGRICSGDFMDMQPMNQGGIFVPNSMLVFPESNQNMIYSQINGVVSLQEVQEEDSEPVEDIIEEPAQEQAEGESEPTEETQEEATPVVEEMHIEDFVMLHEGAVLKLIIIFYILIEVSVFLLLTLFAYIKIRLQVDKMSWDITGFFLEMKSYQWYKKKMDDIKNHRTADDEDAGPILNDEELLREEFKTVDQSYATDNFRKF